MMMSSQVKVYDAMMMLPSMVEIGPDSLKKNRVAVFTQRMELCTVKNPWEVRGGGGGVGGGMSYAQRCLAFHNL